MGISVKNNLNFKSKKGFTLVELVVVIAILGILAGIAIPRFMEATVEARSETCLSNRVMIVKAFEVAKGQGLATEDGLQDFVDSIQESGNNYESFFNTIPRCPDWDGTDEDKYTVVDGNLYCSHHTDDIVNGDGSISSDLSLLSEVEEFIGKYKDENSKVNGWDLIKALVSEYDELPALTDNEVSSILTDNGIDTEGKEFYWSADSNSSNEDETFIMITANDSDPTQNYDRNGKTSYIGTSNYGWAEDVYAIVYNGNTYVSNDAEGTSVKGWIAGDSADIANNLSSYFTKITDN